MPSLIFAACGFLSPPTETYTVAVAGVVNSQPRTTSPLSYTVEGREQQIEVKDFVAGSAATVGDVLLAGDGRPTWGFTARRGDPDCWVVTGDARIDGSWIDLDTGGNVVRPGVAIHVRIPKALEFNSPVGTSGRLLGNVLCVNRNGEVVAAH